MLSNYRSFFSPFIEFNKSIDKSLQECELIFEVSKQAPKSLKKLETSLIPDYQLKRVSKKNEKEIINHLKSFTGFKKIKIHFDKNFFNCGILPIYDFEEDGVKSKLSSIINIKTTSSSLYEQEQIKDIKEIELLNPNIKGMELFLGLPFIKKLKTTPAELVAAILHEIGHVYYHKSLTPVIFKNLSKVISKTALKFSLVWSIVSAQSVSIRYSIILSYFLLSRTFAFF